ncbi:MAG: hypothetical protein F6K31_14195 [Symploca sp. SIO2G7]|nr:hypothetical protein [Symploca sp. SIO2G7]
MKAAVLLTLVSTVAFRFFVGTAEISSSHHHHHIIIIVIIVMLNVSIGTLVSITIAIITIAIIIITSSSTMGVEVLVAAFLILNS